MTAHRARQYGSRAIHAVDHVVTEPTRDAAPGVVVTVCGRMLGDPAAHDRIDHPTAHDCRDCARRAT